MIHFTGKFDGFLLTLATGLTVSPGMVLAESDSPYPDISIPFGPESVNIDNVYYFKGQSGVPGDANQGFTSNAGFVITGDGVVVFDALGTPSLAAAMIREIRKLTDQPVTHVVVSHYHADHIYGLQAFRELTDADIIAQESSNLYITSPDAKQRLEQRQQALSPWVHEKTRVIPPDVTFKDETFLESGSYQFSIYHAGPAHAPDDSMMMGEPGAVLFSGDIIQNGRVPFLNSAEVDTGNWMKAIEKVRKLEPKVLIPGHGRASSDAMEALDFTYNYIEFVRSQMKRAVENWVPFEDAYQQTDWSSYESLPAFDASNKANAYRVYLDMEKTALGSE